MSISIIHPDKQHSPLTAEALIDFKGKTYYFTQIYKTNSVFYKILFLFFPKLNVKYSKNIAVFPLENVFHNNPIGFLRQFLIRSRILFLPFFSQFLNFIWFFLTFLKIIKIKSKIIISYDFNSFLLYKFLNLFKVNVIRILDLSAPKYDYFINSISKNTSKKYDLNKNGKYNKFNKRFSLISNFEIKNADYFLVASELSKYSLVQSGIESNKILIIRYGINSVFSSYDELIIHKKHISKSPKPTILFMGKFTYAKGFNLFLDFVKANKSNYHFIAIGQYDKKKNYFQDFRNLINFTGFLEKSDMKNVLLGIDFLFFLSFCDGFGLTVLECMNFGIIPIVSKYAGISDIIVHGQNGFVVDPLDVDSIIDILNTIINNKDKMLLIKRNAFLTSIKLTKSQYSSLLRNEIEKVC